ncbi:MAG: PilZ domain-containing protein [Oscillospiraceae bacterium]|nr:PilZ domain-containing protein [Oscillospiraceae bacterium]
MTETPEGIDFGLRPGMTVEVLTPTNQSVFLGRVEGFQDGAVTLRDSKGNELPRVVYNQDMKLRYAKGDDTAIIQGKICGSTGQIWKLDRLTSKVFKEQRAFFRQGISTNIQAECFRCSLKGEPEEKGSPCKILDVSAGGLMFASGEEYKQGERLLLSGIRLAESMPPFNFRCQVRRVGPEEEGIIRYGCQFEAMPPKEDDRLLRAIFIVQREEMRSRKDKGM